MLVKPKIDLKELYEIDDYLWLEETVKLLKEKRLNELDLDNLIEELEALSRRDRNAICSYVELIICHLLYLKYWEIEYQYNAHHWESEIANFRNRLEKLLTNNLRNYLEQELENIYKASLRVARKKTKDSLNFPSNCPYNLKQILDHDWYPE